MPEDGESRRLAEIQNVSEDECYEHWEGVYWEPVEEGAETGICKSDYDFDAWITDQEKREEKDES